MGLTAYRVADDDSGGAPGGKTPRFEGRGALSVNENVPANQLPASPGCGSQLAKTPGGGLPLPHGLHRLNKSRVTKAQFKEMLRLDTVPPEWGEMLRAMVPVRVCFVHWVLPP